MQTDRDPILSIRDNIKSLRGKGQLADEFAYTRKITNEDKKKRIINNMLGKHSNYFNTAEDKIIKMVIAQDYAAVVDNEILGEETGLSRSAINQLIDRMIIDGMIRVERFGRKRVIMLNDEYVRKS